MFSCEYCEYTSDRAPNVYRHMSKVHAGFEWTELECSKCLQMVYAVEIVAHESKCTGVHILQCPICLEMFENKHQKASHKKRYANIDCRIVNNGGGEARPQVLDFASTQNTALIIAYLRSNPAEIQAAHKLGDITLHQALTRISHFTGPLATRNITRMDRSNSIAKVIVDGKAFEETINRVLDVAEKRNREIANTPCIKKFLTKDMDQMMLPMPASDKEWREQRFAIRGVMAGKGAMNSRLKEMFPTDPPPAQIQMKILACMAVEAMDTMPANKDAGHVLQGILLMACNQYAYKGGQWWTPVGNGVGWVICENAPKRIEDIVRLTHQHAVEKSLALKNGATPGPEFDRIRSMSDRLGRFNVAPSVHDVIHSLMSRKCLSEQVGRD